MNLADPELEFIDPTPNVYSLFIHFDSVFFWTKLAGKAVVRWSKRMYSCAGTCSYEGRGGICDIALSEPLLKLRPRKDLVETLLHEMIHAYLFVVGKDQGSRDGHGPNFLAHMHRINQAAGVNISVYHDFHDEVRLYQNHVWRCNGPCQKIKPFFGIVRRSNNRAPGPSDFWWNTHKRVCGGTFIKCKEPEKPAKPTKQATYKVVKTFGDITKYIVTNNNNETIKNKNDTPKNTERSKSIEFSISSQAIGTNISIAIPKPIIKTQATNITPNYVSDVTETVRNKWANKTLPTVANVINNPDQPKRANKTKISFVIPTSVSPAKKFKKIDDYFKTATNILKDVYGKDFQVTQSADTNKLKAVAVDESANTNKLKAISVKETLVQCPICKATVNERTINSHVDECLNKDIVEILNDENEKQIKQEINTFDQFNPKIESTETLVKNVTVKPKNNYIDLTYIQIKQEADIKDGIDLNQPSTSKGLIKTNIEKEVKEENKYIDLTHQARPATSKAKDNTDSYTDIHTCPCCNKNLDKPLREHLDECLIFFDENQEVSADKTIVIDDSDDEFDETQTFNATGTKTPCPCCMKMIEECEMTQHLDVCLSLKREDCKDFPVIKYEPF